MNINFTFKGGKFTSNKKSKLLNKDKNYPKNINNTTNSVSDSNLNDYDTDKKNNLNSAFDELEELIGLENVKKFLKELKAYVYIQKERKNQGMISDTMVLHMIFKGNPGTGKTTVARILANFFKEMDILDKGHLVEVERADLVGEYIGHTAQRTRENIKKALGGILFIDEAYSLSRGGEKDFGKEAIDCLVKAMEDHKDDFILILAGYKNEMEKFIKSNPGLKSRFPIQIEFPDYSIEELVKIAKMMLYKKQYKLTMDAEVKLEKILRKKMFLENNYYNGNARLIRNMIENFIRQQAYRLVENEENLDKKNLVEIKPEDILDDFDEDENNNKSLIETSL